MGLGKKLGQLNDVTQQNLASASAPVSDAGYNSVNVSNLHSEPLTNSESQQIQQLSREALLESDNANRNVATSLRKPNVPSGSMYPNEQVSSLVVEKMWRIISLNKLHNFYTQDRLQLLVNRACKHDYKILMSEWHLPTIDMTVDLAVLGLYDIVVFGDDSGSMVTVEPKEDNMTRWEILKNVVQTIGFWASLMDSDGVVVRFINSNVEGNGVSDVKQINNIFRSVRPCGGTALGKQLENKVFDAIVKPLVQQNKLERPVLVLSLTDGTPDSKDDVKNMIIRCRDFCKNTKYGEKTMAFSFAQIGSDSDATQYLGELDRDANVGKIIDCTSEFSIEKTECGQGFTEAVWVVKTMIGAVDPAYDEADEQAYK